MEKAPYLRAAQGLPIYDEPDPDIIYHYCSPESFLGILKSGTIWLSHQSTLNDYSDTCWADANIRAEIESRRTSENTKVIEFLLLVLIAIKKDNFIASFSTLGGVLSQWRAYAADGTGYSIGFRRDAFPYYSRVPHLSDDETTHLGVVRINYDVKLLEQSISTCFPRIFPEKMDAKAAEIQWYFRNWALAFKNPAFEEEHELRLIFSTMIGANKESQNCY